MKREFELDEEELEDLKLELIEVREITTDKDGKMPVWTGGETREETVSQTAASAVAEPPAPAPSAQLKQEAPAGERRSWCYGLTPSAPVVAASDGPDEPRRALTV
jgi:hypothetical protein